MKRYTIGKMAKLNNVTEQTLRLYDKMGLFKPAYVDEHNGYRLYDIGQSARLDIIQYLKNLGMTLKEIKEIFDSKNLELLQEKLEESMPTDCSVLRTPTILPNLRISWDYHPTFMLISGRVLRSFTHL